MISGMRKRGFTLIELLVVVSIVGLLSSVVLASLNAVRGKAQIAAGQKFSTSLYRAYGAEAIATYDFDEASGIFLDSSNKYNLTASNINQVQRNSDTTNGSAYSLKFLDTNTVDYARTAVGVNVNVGSVYTLSAWVKQTVNSPGALRIFLSFGPYYMSINSNNFFYVYWLTQGGAAATLTSTSPISLNVWNHITLTHSGNTSVLYVNGREVRRDSLSTSGVINAPLFLGSHTDPSNRYPFAGLLDDVRIYSQSLVASDVQKLYADTKDKYLLAHSN